MDPQKRIVIPEQFRCNSSEKLEVHYYYSIEDKLFYIRLENEIVKDEFFIGKAVIETKKYRIYLLKEILKTYNLSENDDILLAKKQDRIYLIPLKKD